MQNHVLVTYATRSGTTAEVALRIGQVLERQGLSVDVLPVKDVKDLQAYQAVVVGSGIRTGNLLPGFLAFLQKHQSRLQQMPLSLFVVCLTLKEDNETNRAAAQAFLAPARALVQPVREGLLAGALITSRLGMLERLMMKAMKAPDGDYRNWTEIEAWAEALAGTLLPEQIAA